MSFEFFTQEGWQELTRLELWIYPSIVFTSTLLILGLLKSIYIRRSQRSNFSPVLRHILKKTNRPVTALWTMISFKIALKTGPQVLRDHETFQLALKIGVILSVLWVADRAIYSWFEFDAKGAASSSKSIVRTLIRSIAFTLGALVILEAFGVSITPLLASLGVGSLAVALALQEPLSNFFNGLYLVTDKPIQVDHYVKLDDGTEGKIQQINWRSTRMITPQGNAVIIPNSKIATSKIVNYSLPHHDGSVSIPIGIDYNSDLEKIEKVTLEVAREVQSTSPECLVNFEPSVLFTQFADSSIGLNVVLKAARFDVQGRVKHQFIKAIYARYQQEKINIPYPQLVVRKQDL